MGRRLCRLPTTGNFGSPFHYWKLLPLGELCLAKKQRSYYNASTFCLGDYRSDAEGVAPLAKSFLRELSRFSKVLFLRKLLRLCLETTIIYYKVPTLLRLVFPGACDRRSPAPGPGSIESVCVSRVSPAPIGTERSGNVLQ